MSDAVAPPEKTYLEGLARAFAGATLFAVPLLMTQEMWRLGFHTDRWKLALYLAIGIPTVILLSRHAGFRHTTDWLDDVMDGLSAMFVGAVVASALLLLMGVIAPDQPLREIVGKIAIQTVPAAIGAVIARKQLGRGRGEDEGDEDDAPDPTYFGELFLMSVGTLFIALNVAPTEEVLLIARQMAAWQAVILVVLSLGVLHVLVYKLGLPGQEQGPEGRSPWAVFIHFSAAGYLVALATCLYILWTFDRTDGAGAMELLKVVVVLGFPGAIGAAIARLVV